MAKLPGSLILILLGSGCHNHAEREARGHLEADGIVDVTLIRDEAAEGAFKYTARRKGDRCQGSIAVSKGSGHTKVTNRYICRPDVAACDAGKGSVCFRLGELFIQGDPDPVDPTVADKQKALRYFEQGCDLGHGRSCNALGTEMVDKDVEAAAKLFDKSCDLRAPRGCFNLALSFHYGKGVAVDTTRANHLYQRACDADVATACHNLGVNTRDGVGRDEDATEAARMFTLACNRKHWDACVNLGVMYATAAGIDEDIKLARRAFDRACRGGAKDGCDALAKLDEH